MDPETADRNWFSDVVKDRKNYFRYYRDLSIIITVALYGLVLWMPMWMLNSSSLM